MEGNFVLNNWMFTLNRSKGDVFTTSEFCIINPIFFYIEVRSSIIQIDGFAISNGYDSC